MSDVVLGPGAKGDPANPAATSRTHPADSEVATESTVEEVKAEVEAGRITVDAAIDAELARQGGPRSTLLTWLEERDA